MLTSIAISREEHTARVERLCEHVAASSLSGAVLFDPYYVLYYTGFAFIPTERPIAFVVSAEGERRCSCRGSRWSTRAERPASSA